MISFIDYFVNEIYAREANNEYFVTPTKIDKHQEPLKVDEVLNALHYFMSKYKATFDFARTKNKNFINNQPNLKDLTHKQILAFIIDEVLSTLKPENFNKADYEDKYNTYAYSFTINHVSNKIPLITKPTKRNEMDKLYIKFKFITKNIKIQNNKIMGLTPTNTNSIIADFKLSWLDIISMHFSRLH